ncbi:MBOAT family O-acyltransferase [Eubacterium xylanophilum]|uniref:MBOAT family O-acyltransferase n=1 Tax=Eubacterium xylanophilum TaxID=39497 RepID=UPI00047DE4B6|nr:MBOAT family O-acyltransferase [Eubacterium xylanophilum]
MIFSTYQFILLFLPITFVGYFVLHRFKYTTLAKLWLVLASFFFYAQGSPDFFPFFLGSVVGNYVVGTGLSKLQGKEHRIERGLLLAVGVLANVGLLGYYKYTDFFINNVNFVTGSHFPLQHIILPIGISFFTFQLIAFLVDSFRGETKTYDVMDYLLFITFFPQLIVGPIIHHAEVVPQFENTDNHKIIFDNVAKGIFIFAIGCAKKMLIADPLTTDAQSFFDHITNNLPMIQSWFHSVEYTVSYYFDLSGYADMAIGLGWMFNIKIPQNFNSPYKAKDFQEYWQRWHMTLSRFLGAYIFRNVYRRGVKYRNYYIATMVTFFVSGFWHGAGWTFVAWGVINGALVCLSSWIKRKGVDIKVWYGLPLTFLFAILVRVLFVSNTFSDAYKVFKGMFNFSTVHWSTLTKLVVENWDNWALTAVGLGICWFLPTTEKMSSKFKTNWKYLAYAAVLLTICILNMDKVVQFLYFQF